MTPVQKYRQLRGLTQYRLAKLVEIDASTLSKIERGLIPLGLTRARRIAAVLQAPLLALLAPTGLEMSPRRPRSKAVSFREALAWTIRKYGQDFAALAAYDRNR